MRSFLELPDFFVDRSLGRYKVPDALRAQGLVVHTMHSVYPGRDQDVADVDWIRNAGANDWIVLTKDDRIRYRALEIAAVESAALRMFCLTSGNMTGAQQAERFVQNLNRILQRARKQGPYIYAVYEARLKRIWPET